MKAIYLAISILIATLIANFVTSSIAESNGSACSDYFLLGRTYDKCITDKRINE